MAKTLDIGYCASLSCIAFHTRTVIEARKHKRHAAVFCRWCGDYVPLGPATDNEQTAIEVRAAHLASIWPGNSSQWNGYESLGLTSDGEHVPLIERDIAEGRKTKRDLDAYLAGHLARQIATHEEP